MKPQKCPQAGGAAKARCTAGRRGRTPRAAAALEGFLTTADGPQTRADILAALGAMGFKKTAAYSATATGGRFADVLAVDAVGRFRAHLAEAGGVLRWNPFPGEAATGPGAQPTAPRPPGLAVSSTPTSLRACPGESGEAAAEAGAKIVVPVRD